MEKNLIGELRIMKDLNIKPNFSSLARTYNCDRHTVKKYYENNGVPPRKTISRTSKWDPLYDEIVSLMEIKNVTKKAVFMYLFDKYKDTIPGNYDSFRGYTLRKGITFKNYNEPHVLYEVEPGAQLQCDWKENLVIHLKDGNEIKFNVFSATLGYSREHVFVYSTTKTTEDFIRCIIEVFRRLGGVSNEVLTDNMSAIVSIQGKDKKKNTRIVQLFKDLGCNLKLCKAKKPQTKGKGENSNKFVKWIFPYDYTFENEEQIIKVIEETITSQSNRQINTGTKMPPYKLFQKEKEYLKPLPSNILLESYIKEHSRQTVPATLLVNYKGNKYSVPSAYIGKAVDIYPTGDSLYIYHNRLLIAKHTITQNTINYNQKHYQDALTKSIKSKEIDIEKVALENLKRLEKLGND